MTRRKFKTTRKCACGCGKPVTSYKCQPRKYASRECYHAHMVRPVRVCSVCGSKYKLKRRLKLTRTSRAKE